MNQSIFDKLIAGISSKLQIMKELGMAVTTEVISEKIDEIAQEYSAIPNFEMTVSDVRRLKFQIGNMFSIKVGESAIILHSDLPRWFDSRKEHFDWSHWEAYKEMLLSQARSMDIIDKNEEVINAILDYSGDPATPGSWARKGLVMGNVQSGKTQNYIGLINKAIDCGYKTIILLGGHINDLRKQTQERVDEGVLGRTSKHLIDTLSEVPSPIGVGIFRQNSINTGTTTVGDFNKDFADKLGFKLTGEDPVIFTIKKQTKIMERLYKWIEEYHYLNPENDIKLDGPLLLIDDEADYASINTKHHKEKVTKTNEYIRQLLSLFRRNTYVGYTATPFANIFIDPDDNSYSDNDDLFPSDFMIKIPVPDNYLGQDYYFGKGLPQEVDGSQADTEKGSPTVVINDHDPIYELKGTDEISTIPESLREAVRAFVLVIAIRALRGDEHAHNTMLVNISHLKKHQNKLEYLIYEYYKEIDQALDSFSGLGIERAHACKTLEKLETTFKKRFFVEESYSQVFGRLKEASGKVKVWAINQSDKKSDGKELNYSIHKEHGLCAIVIGGHKLSRGLTLEGLSISYFARNSKAYDTLMQMCRWFGYRPDYDDLCRVYLPQESVDWYAFISSAIRELYQELDLMSRREQRPKEFGLKVREHPGAMIITAKNKMGAAESEVRSQDLWGQVQRRFRFRKSVDVNQRNLDYAKNFVEHLMQDRMGTDRIYRDRNSGALVISDVDYSSLIEFIKNIDLPEDDLGNPALINHLKKMRDADLGKPKVILFNQAKSGNPTWEREGHLSPEDISYINKPYSEVGGVSITLAKRRMDSTADEYRIKSVHLGNPDDEKLFLSEPERIAVKDDVGRKPVSFDYICAEGRDYPGLIIYLFAVAVSSNSKSNEDNMKLGHGQMPTVGYTVSLPRSENLKGKSSKEIRELVKKTRHSYQVNKIHSQLQILSPYEDYDDDE
ncbi:MAG: Z1 domain-containing protein [Porticoccaceae bacterium]